MKVKGYLATHFFNEAGFEYTANLAAVIRTFTDIQLYVPQENGEINEKSGDDSHITDITIADGDCKHLDEANILIADLSGVEIDSGVSAEIGYFSGLIAAENKNCASPKTRFIIGIYSDMRQDGTGDNHHYINLFTKGLSNKNGFIVRNRNEAVMKLMHLEQSIKETPFGGKK
jgi:Nucleoside 2-deoxyribosyltransferase